MTGRGRSSSSRRRASPDLQGAHGVPPREDDKPSEDSRRCRQKRRASTRQASASQSSTARNSLPPATLPARPPAAIPQARPPTSPRAHNPTRRPSPRSRRLATPPSGFVPRSVEFRLVRLEAHSRGDPREMIQAALVRWGGLQPHRGADTQTHASIAVAAVGRESSAESTGVSTLGGIVGAGCGGFVQLRR